MHVTPPPALAAFSDAASGRGENVIVLIEHDIAIAALAALAAFAAFDAVPPESADAVGAQLGIATVFP